MKTNRVLRTVLMVTFSMALALGVWGLMPTRKVAAAICTWNGSAGDGLWQTASNWTNCGSGVPGATDDVVLDNSLAAGSYTVTLPSGNVKVTINKLTITPDSGNTITLILPSDNTYGASGDAGFVVGDNTLGTDDIILNPGAILINASGATSGNGIQVNSTTNGTIRINDGGRYIHKTSRSTAGIVPRLSTATGTELGVFEYDSPGTASVAISASGRNYGTLVLTRSAGPATYTASGGSPLTIRGNFLINSGVTYNSTMTGDTLVAGNWTNNGAGFSHTSTVVFNGTAEQIISGSSTTTFNNLTVNPGATVVIPATNIPTVAGTLTNNGTLKQTQTVNNATVSFLTISTDKYRGVDIATTNNLGEVTVAIRGNTTNCTTNPSSPAYVKRCFSITPTNNAAATLTLWATDGELNGIANADLALYRYVSGSWAKQLTNFSVGTGSNSYNYVTADVDGFSSFLIGHKDNTPTAVTLSGLKATSSYGVVALLVVAAGLLALRKRK